MEIKNNFLHLLCNTTEVEIYFAFFIPEIAIKFIKI
ncbi:hypothetical protein QE441_003190 [Chryseobacterium sp. SORGH_AS909]|uniref:Uncharacterized protein n=1 Tax=Chryseobacterium camelliae TaxID=1265445 RepID=A0ABU0TGD5_9FLAO|nr:hypothetical protein [Chryseobacterium camelliae]MDQ1100053.1 hypothetical protein [Chryseobacterium sp. SORGH_AS_1048]MDR6087396.1 hypothetical protein [Chryseobacterium sp. SORGH_AS_0909]MDR6131771.1 hypothetical protein [Chryseobacterium sp. SORGH_AS_1175]